ncbi:hypothetical protein RHSIM_Rhsim10G0208600 [Rhododendron simsii]|uniref:Uncharacterized protein n=1 Tax=Rhododendron simsii TaxID=118357 RepID=A0A834GGF7_RHOSS|nr:hypothetical protein RHSIM_Rhsim10G0208600 [Rhododendron simsii]
MLSRVCNNLMDYSETRNEIDGVRFHLNLVVAVVCGDALHVVFRLLPELGHAGYSFQLDCWFLVESEEGVGSGSVSYVVLMGRKEQTDLRGPSICVAPETEVQDSVRRPLLGLQPSVSIVLFASAEPSLGLLCAAAFIMLFCSMEALFRGSFPGKFLLLVFCYCFCLELEAEEMEAAKGTREKQRREEKMREIRERKMWELWGMNEMNFWKMYLMWKKLEEETGETELREMIETEMRKMEMETETREMEMETLRATEMEKCLCLIGRGPEGKKGPVLYLFNLLDERASTIGEDKEDEDGKQHRRWPGMQVITPAESIRRPEYFNTSVVVGSVLYALGGLLEDPENEQEDPENEQEDPENEQDWSFHNQVFLFDTNHPKEGWIKGPDMLNDRCSCKAVAVESKIYVFGGNNMTTRPWAEFLDPEKNKWEPLPALPDDSLMHDLVYIPVVYGGPGEGKKIILSCRRYIYHVDAQTWEEFRPPEEMRNFSSNLTSVGNILYWTTFGNLFSFDMKTRDVDFGLVQGYKLAKYEEQFLTEPTLLHLEGDYFCFITLKDLPEGCTQVRCSKFLVSRQGWFKASIVCCNTCIIDCPVDIDWSNAFVL